MIKFKKQIPLLRCPKCNELISAIDVEYSKKEGIHKLKNDFTHVVDKDSIDLLEQRVYELLGDQISVIISEIEDWEKMPDSSAENREDIILQELGYNKCLNEVLELLQTKF